MWTGLLLAVNFLGKTFLFVHRGTAAFKLLLPAWFPLWPETYSEQDCDLFSLDKLNDEKKKKANTFFFFLKQTNKPQNSVSSHLCKQQGALTWSFVTMTGGI